jgi:epsilon-lactone hydrolase
MRLHFLPQIHCRLMVSALMACGALMAFGQSNPSPGDTVDPDGTLRLAPRTIQVPKTISEAAQAYLTARSRQPAFSFPPATDQAAWKKFAEGVRARTRSASEALQSIPAIVEPVMLNGVAVYVGTAKTIPASHRGKVVLDLHGGGFIFNGGEAVRLEAGRMAARFECVVYAVDYRMPPEYPFPAALDDVVAAYRAMLKKFKPAEVVFMGESAGGNLAAAATLKIRELGLPLPAALILNSPEVDLTESGDSFQTNRTLDALLKDSFMQANLLYAGGHDLKDPFLSPLFGDFSKGFPPTYIQAGTRDLMLSNSARFHVKLRAAGIDAMLYVGEAMPHTGFGGGTPEDEAFRIEQRRFLDRSWHR